MNVTLVERLGKRAYLTEAGEKLVDHARSLLDEDSLERYSADEEPLYRVLYLACWNARPENGLWRQSVEV